MFKHPSPFIKVQENHLISFFVGKAYNCIFKSWKNPLKMFQNPPGTPILAIFWEPSAPPFFQSLSVFWNCLFRCFANSSLYIQTANIEKVVKISLRFWIITVIFIVSSFSDGMIISLHFRGLRVLNPGFWDGFLFKNTIAIFLGVFGQLYLRRMVD